MVEYTKPDSLFLELDNVRLLQVMHGMHGVPSEFATARYAAGLDVPYNPGDIYETEENFLIAKFTKDLCDRYGIEHVEKLQKIAKYKVRIDKRDLLMTSEMWLQAEKYPTTLALVGRNHAFGIRHYWHMMKICSAGLLEEADQLRRSIQEEAANSQSTTM